jgi:ABC-type uncharacterized transport system permease subunit
MDNILSFLGHLLPILYAAAWVNYSVFFVRDDPFARRTATPFLLGTAVVHILYIVLLAIAYRHHPMASVFEVLSIVALALTLVYLAVEIRQKNKSTGVFILPVVFVLQLISSVWIDPTRTIDPLLRDPLFGLHTGTVTLGYVAFFLSAVYGVMHKLLYRTLRRKKFGLIFERLPSLDVLTKMTMGAILVGFFFLTFSVILGAVWASEQFPGFWRDSKFILTIVVWIVYGLSLVSHYILKWTGRRVVSLALVAFAVMVLSILSTNLLLPGFHQEFGV